MNEDPLFESDTKQASAPAPVEATPETLAGQPSLARPLDPLQELRLIIYALVGVVLLISVALNISIYKQNRRVQLELENANGQLAQLERGAQFVQNNRAAMENLLREIAAQASAHPDAQQILARYNLSVQQAAPAAPAPTPATASTTTPAKK